MADISALVGKISLDDNNQLLTENEKEILTDLEAGKYQDEKRREKQSKENQEEEDKRKECYAQKYSNDKLLAEAVLIGGNPKFLVSHKFNSSISICDDIELQDKIVKPFEAISYINRPYSFSSEAQLNECIHKVKNESLDSVYMKVKSIWKKYIDPDDCHISICAADCVFTHFQD